MAKQKALIEEYTSSIDFRDKLARQLEIKIREVQKNNKDVKVNTKISFVSLDSGELNNTNNVIKLNIPTIEKKAIDIYIEKKDKYKENKSKILKEINDQIEKMSTIPIVFGIENKSIINLNNFLVEVQFKLDEKRLSVFTESKRYMRSNFFYSMSRNFISDELFKKLNNLDNEGVLKINGDHYSFTYSDISMQKERIKIIRPYIFLVIKDAGIIDFDFKLYAENLLECHSHKCSLEIQIEKTRRQFTDFIPDIDNFLDEDDIQF